MLGTLLAQKAWLSGICSAIECQQDWSLSRVAQVICLIHSPNSQRDWRGFLMDAVNLQSSSLLSLTLPHSKHGDCCSSLIYMCCCHFLSISLLHQPCSTNKDVNSSQAARHPTLMTSFMSWYP